MNESSSRWRSPSASPLPLRNQFPTDEQQYNHGNTSPIILQRFYHQQKQQQMAKEAEESGILLIKFVKLCFCFYLTYL